MTNAKKKKVKSYLLIAAGILAVYFVATATTFGKNLIAKITGKTPTPAV